MKYKILLAGKNQTTIDDFFYVMSDEFECLTTSIRNVDIENHINCFHPDAFVYCMSTETRENILKLINALELIDRRNLNLVLVGDTEPCYEFMNLKPEMVRLMLLKPIAAGVIKSELFRFLEERRKIKEQLISEEMEKKKRADETIKHILVVDDDPMMLRLLKNELKDEYNIATAVNGKIALNFLAHKKTDLILLDYEMPEENGVEVLRKIRDNEETKDIPVVFLTGINEREKIQKVLAMKPQGYILKPIECNKLMEIIHKIIG